MMPAYRCRFVRKLCQVTSLIMLIFWGLASVHCELEQVPALHFLACCHHEGSTPHQDNDCNQDSCASVETGFYMLEGQTAFVSEPDLFVALLAPLAEPMSELCGPLAFHSLPGSLQLPNTWQFTLRAALPVRAPSLPS